MTGISDNNDPLDGLADLLDTWGGDAERWPAHIAPKILAELSLPGAHALIEEARALDRVIAAGRNAPAARSPTDTRRMTDRILAAAMAESATKAADPRVVPFPERGAQVQVSEPRTSAYHRPAKSFERQWQSAKLMATGLMAASLLAGVYIGGNLNVGPLVQELADVAGISSAVYSALADDLGEDETL